MQQGSPIGNEEKINQIKRMMSIVKSSSNPQAMLEMMSQSNPELKSIISLVNNNPIQARSLFYEEAKRKGLDEQQIQAFLSQLANSSL